MRASLALGLMASFSSLNASLGRSRGRSGRKDGKVLVDVNFLSETSDKATSEWRAARQGASILNPSHVCTASLPLPDMAGANSCLGLSTRLPSFSYPVDAEEHFLEVEDALAKYKQKSKHRPHRAASYGGPWLENLWISHFEAMVFNSTKGNLAGERTCLRQLFGPFIPILIPWTDRWMGNSKTYPGPLVGALRKVLRPDVLYVTLCQNDVGLEDIKSHMHLADFPNLLLLSSGGYGHVPVPLLKQEEAPLGQGSTKIGDHLKQPIGQRKILASFTGNIGHSPAHMRGHMNDQAKVFMASHRAPGAVTNVTMYHGERWREVMAESRLSLCPRGYGRTSYHISETVQMGLVPVHVWLDEPWVPYADTVFPKVGYTASLEDLVPLFSLLSSPDAASEIEEKEANALKYRSSHFTYAGVLNQIERFLLNPSASFPGGGGQGSDLRCTRLPSTSRAAEFPEPKWADSL